jgi:hypothetical protein
MKKLRIIQPGEWDLILTILADCMATDCGECIYAEGQTCPLAHYKRGCPVCTCFNGNCDECMPGRGDPYGVPCIKIPDNEKVDHLIERLEREGIWET